MKTKIALLSIIIVAAIAAVAVPIAANRTFDIPDNSACEAVQLHDSGKNLFVQFGQGTNHWRFQFQSKDTGIFLKGVQVFTNGVWQ